MSMLKVDIHRPIGQEDDTTMCNGVIMGLIQKDEDNKPNSVRVAIAGDLTFMDLMVMTRMLVEHVESVAREQFNLPTFDVIGMLKHTSGHSDILEEFDETKVIAH